MLVHDKTFAQCKELMGEDKEGLVFLGCGGNPYEWAESLKKLLVDEEKLMPEAPDDWHVMETTGGRIDLLMPFPESVEIGRLAMWRLRFGDCSWWSDYEDNYASHHGEDCNV